MGPSPRRSSRPTHAPDLGLEVVRRQIVLAGTTPAAEYVSPSLLASGPRDNRHPLKVMANHHSKIVVKSSLTGSPPWGNGLVTNPGYPDREPAQSLRQGQGAY